MPATHVVRLPDGIDFETGAAMMLKGLTAQYLLRRTLPAQGLQPGDFVLFHAAAGGVGLIACQWARALGLQLIGTAGSAAKCELARANGAAHAIDYSKEDFVARVNEITGGAGVKVVYDSVGRDTFERSLQCLRPFGLMALFGASSGPVPPVDIGLLAKKSLYLTRPTLFSHLASREATQAMADELFEVVASGAVKIPVERRYALADAAQAHRDLEARRTTGCSVLLP
jgi:NADPH2:quinone reductase